MTAEDIQRLNFYERQFLRPRDFRDEQAYHIEMRRRHLIAHHTWGIIVGLELLHDAASDTWSVTPGMAVDGYGREIVVFSAEPLDVEAIRSQLAGTVQPTKLKIWLEYRIEKSQRPAAGYEVCEQPGQFIRLRETFGLIYQDDPPGAPPRETPPPHDVLPDDLEVDPPPWPVRLGTIIWDPIIKKITGKDRDGRVYVGNITSEILAPDGSILVRDQARATPLPAGATGVAVTLEGSLQVERLVRARNDLRVDGKVGIGRGSDPIDTRLQVVGGTDATLQNGSGTVVIGKVDEKNLVADNHGIMARENQAASPLHLQAKGGDLIVHQDKAGTEVAIKENGNVGLGIASPGEKLTVEAGSVLTNGEGQGIIVDAAGLKRVGLMKYSGSEAMLVGHAELSLPVRIGRWTGDDIHQPASTPVDLAIDKTGKIGIGTTTPAQQLHVQGDRIRLQSGIKRLDLRADGAAVDLHSETNNLYLRSSGPPGNNNVIINGIPVLGDGNVGVGTQGPIVKLHVQDSKAGDANFVTSHVALIDNISSDPGADVLALKVGITPPGGGNNFITFFGGNTAVGCIEGKTGGVSFVSGAADFAECLPRLQDGETIESSDIVGVFAGRISKRTGGADHLAAVSSSPIVLGNVPAPEQRHLHHPVAFLGQVRVKVRGTVKAGDFIVASGLDDGTGISGADGAAECSPARIIGRAWESSSEQGVKLIRVAVGIAPTFRADNLPAQLVALQRQLDQLKNQLQELAGQSGGGNGQASGEVAQPQ